MLYVWLERKKEENKKPAYFSYIWKGDNAFKIP